MAGGAGVIVISFGMRKSGSTLAWQLARAVLELAGHPQRPLPDDFFHPRADFNRAVDLNDRVLERLLDASRGQRVVVATHVPPNRISVGRLFDAFSSGEVLVHAVLRDPRDVMLSMLDERARKGKSTDFDEVLARICANAAKLRRWCALPSLKLFYEDYAFDRDHGPKVIGEHLGVAVDTDAVWALVDQRNTRRNVARPARYRTELAPDQAAKIEAALPGLVRAVETRDFRHLLRNA